MSNRSRHHRFKSEGKPRNRREYESFDPRCVTSAFLFILEDDDEINIDIRHKGIPYRLLSAEPQSTPGHWFCIYEKVN